MDAPALRLEPVPLTHPDALRLIAEVQVEYVVLYGGPDATPLDPTEFAEGRGLFLVGYAGDEPVASGAWRRRGPVAGAAPGPVAEIKRMYVAAGHRRRGLGRLVLAELETTARAAGVHTLVLETGTAQPEAIAMYEAAGYRPVPAFGFYADSPQSRYFARSL